MHFICEQNEIEEGQSRGFRVAGLAIFGVRKDGQLYFYRNECPHLGNELDWMEHEFLDDDSELIRCQSHGALFAIDTGQCLSGPCAGSQLTAINISEKDSGVYLVA